MKMKNKKQKDIDSKKKHTEQLKATKRQKRGAVDLNRTEGVRLERRSFLIISEGRNNEKVLKLHVETKPYNAPKISYHIIKIMAHYPQNQNPPQRFLSWLRS
ncbi:MAG: hypothetical protein HC817_09010 [Saprospiraceae bacterium]|nr:hypothetical protein [Saprospiraceae bacterium]